MMATRRRDYAGASVSRIVPSWHREADGLDEAGQLHMPKLECFSSVLNVIKTLMGFA